MLTFETLLNIEKIHVTWIFWYHCASCSNRLLLRFRSITVCLNDRCPFRLYVFKRVENLLMYQLIDTIAPVIWIIHLYRGFCGSGRSCSSQPVNLPRGVVLAWSLRHHFLGQTHPIVCFSVAIFGMEMVSYTDPYLVEQKTFTGLCALWAQVGLAPGVKWGLHLVAIYSSALVIWFDIDQLNCQVWSCHAWVVLHLKWKNKSLQYPLGIIERNWAIM